MGVTRRALLQTAIAVAATGAVGATQTAVAGGAFAASSPGDVVGKITVGYQGWFACIGDGAPINAWWHWSPNSSQPPSPSNTGIVAWPDVREYTRTYQTGYAALGNG
ncbi:xylosidase, partial [Streptomyces bryophytorum]|nr:xylosidase [Actinacidiphila bryophytorum]